MNTIEITKPKGRLNLILLFGIFSIMVLFIPLIPYFIIFNGELSNNPNDWSSFGSYYGGIVTPILTFITIIFIIMNLNNQKEQQIEESQKSRFMMLVSNIYSLLNLKQSIIEKIEVPINIRFDTYNNIGYQEVELVNTYNALKRAYMCIKKVLETDDINILKIQVDKLFDTYPSEPSNYNDLENLFILFTQIGAIQLSLLPIIRLNLCAYFELQKIVDGSDKETYYSLIRSQMEVAEPYISILFYGLTYPIEGQDIIDFINTVSYKDSAESVKDDYEKLLAIGKIVNSYKEKKDELLSIK